MFIYLSQHDLNLTKATQGETSQWILIEVFMVSFSHQHTCFLKLEWGRGGFNPSEIDPFMIFGRGMVILGYVDDWVLFIPDMKYIEKVIQEIKAGNIYFTIEDNFYASLEV